MSDTKIETKSDPNHPLPGNKRIVGQKKARIQIKQILDSGRISHAYLLTGQPGVGKLPLALTFAEYMSGVEHLSTLGDAKKTNKTSWFTHPDIHLFFPMPRVHTAKEYSERLQLLAEDPYEIVDYGLRPNLNSDDSSKNKQAFYSIDYYRSEIRRAAFLKPNEAEKTIIVITEVEKMRAETANAFLKLLEEPSDRVMFILTTNNVDALLPTIISRCQIVSLSPLTHTEIEEGLSTYDNIDPKDAHYLARVAGGNYSMTRFYNVEDLKRHRESVIEFLRASFVGNPAQIVSIATQWHGDYNLQGQISILNMLEMFVRDITLYVHTQDKSYITNVDQMDVIENFCKALGDAKLDLMIDEIDEFRGILFQNINARLAFIVLANRLSPLMKGQPLPLKGNEWFHIPSILVN
jgi:DNA polymerase-3 subunit delta'